VQAAKLFAVDTVGCNSRPHRDRDLGHEGCNESATFRRISHLPCLKGTTITRHLRSPKTLLLVWAVAALVVGSALTSYHQPMLAPGETVVAIAGNPAAPQWQAIHVLSGACGCSQRVMRNLLARGPMAGSLEQIIIADGDDSYLPGTELLLQQLKEAKFQFSHRRSEDLVRDTGMRGVPLLVIVSPNRTVAYLGGYGMNGDQTSVILTRAMAGKVGTPLPIFGCAVGGRIRREVDPLGLKYGGLGNRLSLVLRKAFSA
jgi:hypothetical protein